MPNRQRDLPTQEWVEEIQRAGRWVRHYHGQLRTRTGQLLHDQAILRMGVICREAFNNCTDYKALLTAIVDALVPDDPRL